MKSTWLLLVALVLAAACGSSPEPTYYALSPAKGMTHAEAPRLVKLRRPGLVGYLDRSDVVTKVADYTVRVQTNERWGEPLGDMIGRVLSLDLTQRLPGTTVYFEGGALSAAPDAVVETDIQRFDSGGDGAVTLIAQVAVQSKGEPKTVVSKTFTLTAHPHGRSTQDMVASMSGLLGSLADGIAEMLRMR
jgi:uncharacterized lipoprotein YmbA